MSAFTFSEEFMPDALTINPIISVFSTMASPTAELGCFSDVKKVGYLRKPKSMHKRFFVLRAVSASGPSRLEYYENEKKWRHKSGTPKRSIPLESCFNINKRADSKNRHLVALYTKDEYFSIAADSELEQELWYQALVELHNRGKVHESAAGRGVGEDNYGEATPGPAFKEVWQVILKPKGLGQTKNLIGVYRLCLTNKTISFVKLNSDAAAVVLQLMNIRRCGHSENYFLIEVGRSAVTGPGEFWMQVDDSVVAQNMHETILEAMKATSEEFRPRSKSQSSSNCSNPISVPVRRHHHNNPPPSQIGLGRRSRAESVTAASPVRSGKHSHSFRVRASSDGEGTMSRPASVDGSPSSPSTARPQSQLHRGGSRLHPPLNHSRSIPTPTSRCSPSATSPVSLSSSSTSGHGSTSDCLFPRRSSASISGSPSDGGFISSDEYGSSPCDFRSSFRSVTPDSLGHTPPAREEAINNYICMAKPGSLTGSQSRGTPSKVEEHELEKCFRKRTLSSGASPPTPCHQNTQSQSSTASLDEYTVMMPAYPRSRSASSSSSTYKISFMPTHSYPEEGLDMSRDKENSGPDHKDDGYMPMLPGVASATPTVKNGDYMPMSPKSVSAPQQIINPRQHSHVDSNGHVDPNGYMMMSPSGSCSPDGTTNYGKIWTNGIKLSIENMEGKVSSCGEYMNMSPASCSTTSTPPDCFFNPVEDHSRPMYSYFSLPRSFKHANRKQDQSPLRMSLGSSHIAYTDSSSSSASSDSLGGQGNSQNSAVRPKRSEGNSRLTRPARLSLDASKASTLPRTRESPFPPEPKSPGEYVNIEFNDKAFSASLASLFPSVFTGSDAEAPSDLSSSEYMNMKLGSQGRRLNLVKQISTSCSDYAIITPSSTVSSTPLPCETICQRDYISMQMGSCTRYPDTQMMLISEGLPDVEATPCSISPNHDITALSGTPGGPTLIGPLSGLSAFTRVNSTSGWNQGAKVIRADPQGRRRHSSETFASTTTRGLVDTSTTCQSGGVKRHSSASFENVWLRPGETSAMASGERETTSGPVPTLMSHDQNGLNYIDLDLVQNGEQHVPDWNVFQSQPVELVAVEGIEELSAYASINFQKSDETRGNLTHREE
ncbi:insulin receptor substrate 1-B-like [Xyrauchen texanus]|uniref:insulin receptor substrate 1-B-like n=1 Tax=Xyrauchen texanus TaxID=154827 RepID=UPI002241E252|nr:insulin receptor substrate 1-B-like [Xyrauchen texanus]